MKREYMSRRLRSWMADAGMTQKDVADALGVSVGAVKSWIYGTRALSFGRAEQICDLFGKTLDELACREKEAV